MKITWVPSCVGGSNAESMQFCTSAIINETVALDAGTLGFYRSPQEQARIKHVLITHSHIDHVASLPIFVENVYEGKADCVTIYGNEAVLRSCKEDLFNGRIWPDFLSLSENNDAPFLKLCRFDPGETKVIDGLRITSASLNHVVPTLGYVVQDDKSAFAFVTDTGPTEDVWKLAQTVPNLKAIFLEVTFPDSMTWLAEISKHHTPATFAEEMKKLPSPVRWIAIHVKARFRKEVHAEIQALNLPNLELLQFEEPYEL